VENKAYKTKTTTIGDLKPGDKIIGSEDEPIEVTDVYEKHFPKKMYEIEMEDGEVVQASGNHLWYSESEQDIKYKEEYLRLAKVYFENYAIPEKLREDEHYSLNEMIIIFDDKDKIDTKLFIEKACRSLGHSSVTPHLILNDKLSIKKKEDYMEIEVSNYSYNNLIDFLHKMKKAVLENKGYFYFGEVRTTEEIFSLINNGTEINIPYKDEVNG